MEHEEFLDISGACKLVGGESSPIHPATYYRGVRAGRYPRPVKVAPNIARVSKRKLVEALAKITAGGEQ